MKFSMEEIRKMAKQPKKRKVVTKTKEEKYLDRLKQSVGSKNFVEYYDILQNRSDNGVIVEYILNHDSSVSRDYAKNIVSHGKRIFREGLEKKILKSISNSSNVDENTRKQAERLL